jgi:hypothetical protein
VDRAPGFPGDPPIFPVALCRGLFGVDQADCCKTPTLQTENERRPIAVRYLLYRERTHAEKNGRRDTETQRTEAQTHRHAKDAGRMTCAVIAAETREMARMTGYPTRGSGTRYSRRGSWILDRPRGARTRTSYTCAVGVSCGPPSSPKQGLRGYGAAAGGIGGGGALGFTEKQRLFAGPRSRGRLLHPCCAISAHL